MCTKTYYFTELKLSFVFIVKFQSVSDRSLFKFIITQRNNIVISAFNETNKNTIFVFFSKIFRTLRNILGIESQNENRLFQSSKSMLRYQNGKPSTFYNIIFFYGFIAHKCQPLYYFIWIAVDSINVRGIFLLSNLWRLRGF